MRQINWKQIVYLVDNKVAKIGLDGSCILMKGFFFIDHKLTLSHNLTCDSATSTHIGDFNDIVDAMQAAEDYIITTHQELAEDSKLQD